MIFFTNSAQHLSQTIALKKGLYFFKKFCDDEIYLKLQQQVDGKNVWVISSTQAPAENIIELCFLLDALQRNGAQINIFFTYFGYERQDRVVEQYEPLSAQVIFNCLKQFKINKTFILHAHSQLLHQFFNFDSVIPYDEYINFIDKSDVIVAPDNGARLVVEKISNKSGHEFAWLEKSRHHEKIDILQLYGDVKNRNVILIDDIITTGNTIIKAANFLIKNGARSVKVIATHAIFCTETIQNLESSLIDKVYLTNALNLNFKSKKIKLIDISKFIESFLI